MKTNIEEITTLLNEIEELVNICCAITMEPDIVLEKIQKIKELINNK